MNGSGRPRCCCDLESIGRAWEFICAELLVGDSSVNFDPFLAALAGHLGRD